MAVYYSKTNSFKKIFLLGFDCLSNRNENLLSNSASEPDQMHFEKKNKHFYRHLRHFLALIAAICSAYITLLRRIVLVKNSF